MDSFPIPTENNAAAVEQPQQVTSSNNTPPPEDNARCMIVHVDSLNDLAAATDFGWLGISDATCSLLGSPSAEDAMQKNVVVIVSLPFRKSIAAYGIYLGAITKRSEIKETQRRDLPAHWNTVARIGWVRVGEASWESIANASAATSSLLDLFTSAAEKYSRGLKESLEGEDHPSSWMVIPKGGDIVCASIDSASLQVLPHDLRDLHLNPQAAAELAEKNNAAQAQRQMDRSRPGQGGGFGYGTPGYRQQQQPPHHQPQNRYNSYGQQQGQQQYYQQQQYQQQQQQQQGAQYQQPTDPAQAAAYAQYYQYMSTLTPEQQQIAYQHYLAQYQQQQGGAEGSAPPTA